MSEDQLIEALYLLRLSPEKVIDMPPTVLSIIERTGTQTKYIPILSSGDFSLLQGRQKTKKTFFLSAMASVLLGQESSKLRSDLTGTVAYFDTEQSDYYAQKTNQRIYKLSGNKTFDYFALRSQSPDQRKSMIELYAKRYKNCGFIIIDGIVDLMYDFNDLKESQMLVQWLMNLTKDNNLHCINVLHQNSGTDKARGHLGSLIAQKSETIIQIDKHEEDKFRSTISAKDTRGQMFEPFDIEIDKDGVPHLTDHDKAVEIYPEWIAAGHRDYNKDAPF